MSDPIETLKILRAFRPGDILVIECSRPLSDQEADSLSQRIEPLGLKAIVLDSSMKLAGREEVRKRAEPKR